MAKPTLDFATVSICEICHREYIAPKLLTCLHTFCEKCIINTNKNVDLGSTELVTFICPKCQLCTDVTVKNRETIQSQTGLPANQVIENALKINSIQKLFKKSSQLVKCHDCLLGDAKQPATAICLICILAMCEVDTKAHNKHYKNHAISSLIELNDKDILEIMSFGNSEFRCSKHPLILSDSYCYDCHVLFCNSKCILEHQKCEISSNCDQIIFEKKEELLQLMQKADKTGDIYRETIKQYGKRKRDTENALHILKSTIEKEFDILIKSIEERKQEILAKSDTIYTPSIEAYIAESTNLYRKMKSLADATQFCDLILNTGHKSSLPEILDNYKNLFAESNTSDLSHLPEYRFNIDRSIKHSISSLGKLTVVRDISNSNAVISKLQIPSVNDINTFPVAIAIDKQQKIYILDDVTTKIRIFSQSLDFEQEFKINEEIGQVSISVSDEHIFTCFHEQNFIRVFTKAGKQILDLEGGKSGSQDLFVFDDCFTGIDCSGGGHLVVADSGKNRVHVFNPDLNFSHFIGELFEAGALRRPVSVAINSSDQVAVLQWANPCINLYTIKGILLYQFGSLLGSLELALPVTLVYLPTNNLLVLEYKSSHVSVYNADTNLLTRFENLLGFPYKESDRWILNAACDSDGNLYACDATRKEIWVIGKFT